MDWKYPAAGVAFVLSFGGAWALKAWWTEPPTDPIAALEAAVRRGDLVPAASLPAPAPPATAPVVPATPPAPGTAAPERPLTDAEQLSAAFDEDGEPAVAPRSLADLHSLEEIEQPQIDDRVPRTPEAVAEVLEDLRPELEDCLVAAMPAGVAPTPVAVELELRPGTGADRSQLEVADEPEGVDPMSSVPCMTEVLRSVPFEMAPQTEAWTFEAFGEP